MSVPDEEICNAIDDENGGCGVGEVDGYGKKKQRGSGYGANFRKAKQVVLFRFAKVKRRILRKKSIGGGGGGDGCLCKGLFGFGCFGEPRTGESSFRSTTSDPNDPNFTYEMLRAMIEKNDFYSKECNTHLFGEIDDD